MPTEYHFDLDNRLVVSRAWGVLTDDESAAHYHTMSHDAAFDSSFRQLCDLRAVTQLRATPEGLRALACSSYFSPGTKRAFIASADAHFGLARMLQVFCEFEGTEVGVFRNEEEARAWLGLPPAADD